MTKGAERSDLSGKTAAGVGEHSAEGTAAADWERVPLVVCVVYIAWVQL